MLPLAPSLGPERKLGGRASPGTSQSPSARPQLEAWESFCDELGHAPGDVALAWLLHQDGVTGPIIGPRTMEQLEGALRALAITLDEAALKRLADDFPGPRGTAPHAAAGG